jgi:hypothetical protein
MHALKGASMLLHETAVINPARLAASEQKSQPPALLNEGQAASLLGIGRRKFHDVRQQPWFTSLCVAVELGPRALRWHRDELLAAAKNAPRTVKRPEPKELAQARQRAEA